MNAFKRLVIAAAALLLPVSAAQAVVIDIRYDYDTGFFTGNTQAQLALDAAAGVYEQAFIDNLLAIEPEGGNTWTAHFNNPATGSSESIDDLVVAENTLIIYAGARDLGGPAGVGGPGGFGASGTSEWLETVQYRGQDDFGPWGGSIAFDSEIDWHWGVNEGPDSTASLDFLSVALHELGHVFGIGTADSWHDLVDDGVFTGAYSVAEYGEDVPLAGDLAHWAQGTMSFVDGELQEANFAPALTMGERRLLTDLDIAGLQDVGWTLVPEPGTFAALGVASLILMGRPRRRVA